MFQTKKERKAKQNLNGEDIPNMKPKKLEFKAQRLVSYIEQKYGISELCSYWIQRSSHPIDTEYAFFSIKQLEHTKVWHGLGHGSVNGLKTAERCSLLLEQWH